MTTREYLNQINKINFMIETKVEDEVRLRALATKITVPMDGERVKSSPDPDKMTKVVAKIIELDDEIKAAVEDLIVKRKIVYSQIDSIENPDYHKFLTYKYTQSLQAKEIADKMHLSKSAVFIIQADALKDFEEKFGHLYLKENDRRETGNKNKQEWTNLD